VDDRAPCDAAWRDGYKLLRASGGAYRIWLHRVFGANGRWLRARHASLGKD
jgi:hypothetical protein